MDRLSKRRWHEIPAGQIPVVLLVRNHSVLAHIKVAQSTKDMDWDNVELRVFSTDNGEARFGPGSSSRKVKWTIQKMNEQETSPK